MESAPSSAKHKQSLIAIGALMLSLAALQSPLWRPRTSDVTVAVRNGGATLISSDRPIAEIALDQTSGATAQVVGGHEVLIRGTAPGETRLQIASKDGRTRTYHIIVQPESSASSWGAIVSR